MKHDQKSDARSEATKTALLNAAIRLFGQKGYENTSVRDLIEEAKVNLSAINYHFGGKEGLRVAAIDHLATRFKSDGHEQMLMNLSPEKMESMNAEEARATLREIMRTSFISAAINEHADEKARYIQRELIQGGKPTELFFERVFKLRFRIMRTLVAKVTGEEADSERVKIRAISLIAQSVFLNLARPLVLKALDWDTYDESNADLVADSFWLHHE